MAQIHGNRDSRLSFSQPMKSPPLAPVHAGHHATALRHRRPESNACNEALLRYCYLQTRLLHRNRNRKVGNATQIKLFADAEFAERVTLVQQWQFARHEFITNS